MASDELYLIAHKVRGEPALDIAVKMEMADGPWWIIPTSGHRAYPFFEVPLSEFWLGGELQVIRMLPDMPEDLPDHFACNDLLKQKARSGYTDRATSTKAVPNLGDI